MVDEESLRRALAEANAAWSRAVSALEAARQSGEPAQVERAAVAMEEAGRKLAEAATALQRARRGTT